MAKCSKCGFEHNPDNFHYCGECGEAFDHAWKEYDETEYGTHSRNPKRILFNFAMGFGCLAYIILGLIYPKMMDMDTQKWSSTWSLIWDLLQFVVIGGISAYFLILGFKSLSRVR